MSGENFQILEGDMFDRLHDVKPNTVQVACIDPPYMVGSVSASEKNRIGRWGDLMNGARLYRDVLESIRPKLTVDGCLWMFGQWQGLASQYKGACDADWLPVSLVTWDKTNGPGYPVRNHCEYIWLFTMPSFKRRPGFGTFSTVVRCPLVPPAHRVHDAQKPVDLLKRLISFGSDPGDLVLDTFCGSGSTGVAAIECDRRFIGIEIDPGYCETARQRCESAAAQMTIGFPDTDEE